MWFLNSQQQSITQETYQLTIPPHIPAIMKISCTLKKNKILNIRENFKTSELQNASKL